LLRYIHFGLVIFGISSLLTAEFAEEGGDLGFWVHSILGILLGVFILLRLVSGLVGSCRDLSLRLWWNKIRQSKTAVMEDIQILSGLSVPEGELHDGIAGIVQAFGLFTFAWMCLTGMLLFFIELGESGILEDLVEEAHGAGEIFVISFLFLHIGAVVLHYIKGNNLLNRINPF
jgi:cytochrome b561